MLFSPEQKRQTNTESSLDTDESTTEQCGLASSSDHETYSNRNKRRQLLNKVWAIL